MFESSVALTPEQMKWLNKCTKGTWQLNPRTGLVDVNGSFDCSGQGLSDFKGVRFGKVEGGFYCENNQLTTLEGAPQEVGGSFDCENSQLTSLEGAPQKVEGYFSCSNNRLTTLEGAPQKVEGDFYCDNNQLTTLEGAPPKVEGDFSCENNNLVNLIGSPKRVSGSFWCRRNFLTSIEGAPGYAKIFYPNKNPVSENSLENIYALMREGKSYIQAIESLWNSLNI